MKLRTGRKKQFIIKGAMVAAAFIVMSATIVSVVIRSQQTQAAQPTFSVIATHPQALAQPTPSGRTIIDLMVDGNRLYAGYGDYEANTGPIAINPMQLSNNSFIGSQLSVPTEEVGVYRKINGSLYAPMVDPQVPWTSNSGYATNDGGTWKNVDAAPFIHIFDIATLNGSDLWAVGSTDALGATAYRSVDGGATWNVAINEKPTAITDFDRYYWVASVGGKIYLRNQASSLQIYDGTTWTQSGLALCDQNQDARLVEVFNGKIVCASNLSSIDTYDGTNYTHTSMLGVGNLGIIRDFYNDEATGYLYALGDGGIARSTDGVNWRVLERGLSTDYHSIAVYNDYIYLGGVSGAISRSNITAEQMLTPGVSLVGGQSVLPTNTTGKTITISGHGILVGSKVYIGGVEARIISIQPGGTDDQADIEIPARSTPGVFDLKIVGPEGEPVSYVVSNAVKYWQAVPPTITSVSFSDYAPGQRVMSVKGANFIANDDVSFEDMFWSIVKDARYTLNGQRLPMCAADSGLDASTWQMFFSLTPEQVTDTPPCYLGARLNADFSGFDPIITNSELQVLLPEGFNETAAGIIGVTNVAQLSTEYPYNQPIVEQSGGSTAAPGIPRTGLASRAQYAWVVVVVTALAIVCGVSLILFRTHKAKSKKI